jgi:heptosyltransferase-2
MKKILIIQTAFIGDVILATPVIEKLHDHIPDSKIDFFLRKGNESLLTNHPKLNKIYIWDKKKRKYLNLFSLITKVRKQRYDYVINLHRFATSGLVTCFSRGRNRIGFDKNPFSFCYTSIIKHYIGYGKHEVSRNLELIKEITNDEEYLPRLYPSHKDFEKVKELKKKLYICIAPTSIWYTKQYPAERWASLIDFFDEKYYIYLIGGTDDYKACENLRSQVCNRNVKNLCGELTFLESAALMKDAVMNYVNDSAPLHIASSMNANTIAVFCSTIPEFGFGPLSENSKVVQINYKLNCRPCNLHGYKACPQGHFKCAFDIDNKELYLK